MTTLKISDYAKHLLLSPELENKLFSQPGTWEEETDFQGIRIEKPLRAVNLQFSEAKTKIPRLEHLNQASARGLTLHHFANHELMAIELFAWALLAFPKVSKSVKLGFLRTIEEEQSHLKLYLKRMNDFGIEFGDIPLNYLFWKQTPKMISVKHFSAILSLTFEGANLDYSQLYAKAFAHFGDIETSKIMIDIFEDEVRHVKRGLKIIREDQNPGETEWHTYLSLISFPFTPRRAKGYYYFPETRALAGFSAEFIAELGDYSDEYSGRVNLKGLSNIGFDQKLLRKMDLPI